jgi:hypothetical protein
MVVVTISKEAAAAVVAVIGHIKRRCSKNFCGINRETLSVHEDRKRR